LEGCDVKRFAIDNYAIHVEQNCFVIHVVKYIKCSERGIEPDLTDAKSPQKEKLHKIWNLSIWNKLNQIMVREKGLEPSRPRALAPKASVSTNSTTRASVITIAEII
jgi:hypothetical protein